MCVLYPLSLIASNVYQIPGLRLGLMKYIACTIYAQGCLPSRSADPIPGIIWCRAAEAFGFRVPM